MSELSLAPGLLLSMPHLADPNFTRAVVLMVEHNDEGSFGLIVNQASDVPISRLLSSLEMSWHGDPAQRVWTGGPVMPETGWVLYETDDGEDETLATELQLGLTEGVAVRAGPNLALSTSPERLRALASNPPERLRVLLGYSGWGPGQLALEMARGSWLHADVSLTTIFDTPAESMWEFALRTMGVNPETIVHSRGVH